MRHDELGELLAIDERREPDQRTRVIVRGELDLATAPRLEAVLRGLEQAKVPTRLDLSELEFMDCSGFGILSGARRRADADGWELEIEPELTEPVRRLVRLLDGGGLLDGRRRGPASS